MPILLNNTLPHIVNLVNRANSDSVVNPPLSNVAFTLDSSGVAGFFGGESAVRATATLNLVPQRRWFGWYNAPGSYEVAKQYSALAKSTIFDALFPTDDSNPAKILMVDGRVGPDYTPLYSSSNAAPSTIGHLGSLISRKVSQMPVKETQIAVKEPQIPVKDESSRRRRNTIDPCRVTFVTLRRIPANDLNKLHLIPSSSTLFAVITILTSVGGCLACALVADWFSLASIALGIIANGVACSVIGSGQLSLRHNPPAQAHAPGDVLLKSDTDIIVLSGNEGSVSPFTRGRFDLRFRGMPGFVLEQVQRNRHGAREYIEKGRDLIGDTWMEYLIDFSVTLLLFQFLAQLLLIPQGTFFGQLMFLGTLAPSWMYHSYLSSLSLDLQTEALFRELSIQEKADIYQCQLNTWTEAAVFACLVFRSIHPIVPRDEMKIEEEEDPTMTVAEDEVMKMEHTAEIARKRLIEETDKAPDVKAAKERVEREVANSPDVKKAEDEVKAAEVAVESAKQKLAAELVKKKKWDELAKRRMKEDRRKEDHQKEEDEESERKAFQELLDALLPHKTDAWRAFKNSLVRKTTKAAMDSYMSEERPSFHFNLQDASIKDARSDKLIPEKDLKQLWDDANNALLAWRKGNDANNYPEPSSYYK